MHMGLYVLHVTPIFILTLISTNKFSTYLSVGEKKDEVKINVSSMFFWHGDQMC